MFSKLAAFFADQFLRMDRKLIHPRQGVGRVIQFTAAHHGEGTTSLALAFATYLTGVHDPGGILALEANVRRPCFRQLLCLEGPSSLDDVLTGAVSLEDAIQLVGRTNLKVIACNDSAEEADSPFHERTYDAVAPILEALRRDYAVVILDTPPTVPYIDSGIISSMVDAAVLVVQANLTKSHVVQHALDKLAGAGGNVEGLILNKREFFIPNWLYRFL